MRLASLFKRRRAKSGATALEFALVAPIFFVMIFGILEAGAVYIGEAWLQYATSDVGRMVRTGQIQLQNVDQTTFRNMVCARLSPYLPCDGNLRVEVQAYSDFPSANFLPPVDANGNFNAAAYNPGAACQVVLVRNVYKWTVHTPVFAAFLVNTGTDKRLISAAAAFRNEPFQSGVQGCG